MIPLFPPRARLRGAPCRAAAGTVLLALVALGACGGSGGSVSAEGAGDLDPVAYSTAASASLSTPNEAASVTHHALTLGGTQLAYTATAGHLSVQDGGGAPEASFFYVAYTRDDAAGHPDPARPVTIFFNGGPGSASLWLHLGSFAPKRLVTGVPATTQAAPFPYVDNADSLIDLSDLVFVDAIGTGLSEAIAPHRNSDFWGVDVDGAVFRDFVTRWQAANGRTASPLFLYGESYGTVRAPVLARLLETAGVPVRGVVLQSSILNYNSNCSITLPQAPAVGCGGALPSYAAVGAYFGLTLPVPAPAAFDSFLVAVSAYADASYEPQAEQWLALGSPPTPPPGADVATLAAYTGLAQAIWRQHFDVDYDTFRHHLIADTVLGVYDGRVAARTGSALAAGDEPSNAFLAAPFQQAIDDILPHQLGYTNPTHYVMTSDAIEVWNFTHGGHALPDVLPDLAAAISLDPALRILSTGGQHDLITPFHQTELDLARLAADAPVSSHFYQGGHMTYLDDTSRPLMKADLAAFYGSVLGAP